MRGKSQVVRISRGVDRVSEKKVVEKLRLGSYVWFSSRRRVSRLIMKL